MPLGEMTRLEAVNSALSLVGQTAVATLGGGRSALSTMAENIVDEVEREEQARGWWFNTEIDVDHLANSSGEVELGADVFHADGHSATTNYVKRGRDLYDLDEHSFTSFTGTVSLDIIRSLEWLETPTLFRSYVSKKAGRVLVQRYMNDAALIQTALTDELMALEKLQTEDSRQADHNFLSGNPLRWASLNYGGNGPLERGLY